ncbi:DUF2567 domain-containing protein [Rhodococcus sp. D2-41]|uniref:DUF2567 domain-containing protein n=1 Tax=Speluncibacter jeojiensis TaxID=2710754 RepID=A0A9X4LYC0_9ACTN|nr:DUF2567 domain-containing protein [Rhodococcus sp. D2-41]MDG3012044.1 DUF2567 domain-containing protein [Rhodococcus sp. D2-41]MDG3013499.1 DUF2567 domain-containing protein [Corynebacteriales bacterium D3-21]
MTGEIEKGPRRVLRIVRAPALIGIGSALAGALLGVVWGLLAPPEHVLIGHDGAISLMNESTHRFDAIGMFAFMSLALGVLCGAVAWLWRSARGPLMVVGLVLGCLLGAWLAEEVGVSLATHRFPVGGDFDLGQVVAIPPSLRLSEIRVVGPDWLSPLLTWCGGWVALIGQALGAGVVVLLAAVLSPWDGLGAGDQEYRAPAGPDSAGPASGGSGIDGPGPDSGGRPQGGELVGHPQP